MPSAPIIVYNRDMQKVAMLENAFAIGYEMPLNGLWSASFSLPANDPKNAECQPLYYVEIFDESERVELFRIIPNMLQRSNDNQTVTYQCEHVLATLLNDVLFQSHTVGNLGVFTTDVLQYILDRQEVQRWQLGEVAFTRQFEYNWENETLLGALLSVPKPFDGEYQWTYDTTSYPWTLSLVEPEEQVQAYIRYGTNMRELTKTIDPTAIATRIYGLGYGEGVNQLNFADINGGLPYIDAEQEYIDRYGLIKTIFVDRRFEFPETLLARCQTLLSELKQPRITYTSRASDIHRLTGQQIYKFAVGTKVRIKDDELGEDVIVRIVNKRKPDLRGQPADVDLTFANKPQDIAGSIAQLQERQRINDVYAQGATNYNSHDFADNCDPDNPAIIKVWVPEDTARINMMHLSFEVEPFRAYSRSIESAPAVSSGPSSITTTGASSSTTTGASSSTTTQQTNVNNNTAVGSVSYEPTLSTPGTMSTDGTHNHGIAPGTQLSTAGGGVVVWQASGAHSHLVGYHSHSFSSQPHVHNMEHTHGMEHTHNMPHTHIIPAHTHDIEYGIFQGPTATALEVRVDGNLIPGLGISGEAVDIIPFLAKDSSGRITRGTWHTIQIRPNSLSRIVASVYEQLFVQSRGGGNY